MSRLAALGATALIATFPVALGTELPDAAGAAAELAAAATARHGRVVTITLRSAALGGRRIPVLVYLPPGYDDDAERYPTLYLLHGTPGRPGDFVGLGLPAALDAGVAAGTLAPMIVVMPTGGPTPDADTEWADSAVEPAERWGTLVSRDLVREVDRRYRTRRDPRHRAIGGLSMGAFGALNLALRHRMVFGAVTAWSGYVLANTPTVDGPRGAAEWRRRSPLLYLGSLVTDLTAHPLAISFYSGSSDGFLPENRRFDRLLHHYGVVHRFAVPNGGHAWSVWRTRLVDELRWVSTQID